MNYVHDISWILVSVGDFCKCKQRILTFHHSLNSLYLECVFAWIIYYYHYRAQRINLVEKSMIIANHFWEKYNQFIRSWPLLKTHSHCQIFLRLVIFLTACNSFAVLAIVFLCSCGSGWWWCWFCFVFVGDHQNNTRCFSIFCFCIRRVISHLTNNCHFMTASSML